MPNNQNNFNSDHWLQFHMNHYLSTPAGQQMIDTIPVEHIKQSIKDIVSNHAKVLGSMNLALDGGDTAGSPDGMSNQQYVDFLKNNMGVPSAQQQSLPMGTSTKNG